MPPLAVTEFQGAIAELANRSGAAVDKLVAGLGRLNEGEALRFVTEAYPGLLDPYLRASAELSAQWYSEQPAGPRRRGGQMFLPTPAPLPPSKQLATSARWATTQSDPAAALRGASTRHTFNSSRKTIYDNVEREGVRYARQADPLACGFCRMLATRSVTWTQPRSGSLYRTGMNAMRSPHNKRLEAAGHDNCNCIVIPVRNGDYTPPDYVLQWTDDYYAARGLGINDPAAIARAMEMAEADRTNTSTMGSLFDQAPDVPRIAAAVDDTDLPDSLPTLNDELAAQIAPAAAVDDLDQLLAEANEAISAGEFDKADELFTKAENLDAKQKAAQAKRDASRASAARRRDAAQAANYERMSQMIDDGVDPIVAEATAYGISEATVMSRGILQEARSNGYQVKSVEDYVKQVFMEKASEAYFAADSATNGYMLKRKYEGRIDPSALWYCTDKQARTWMSDEMAAWFDANGRITRDSVRQMVTEGTFTKDSMAEDFLQ